AGAHLQLDPQRRDPRPRRRLGRLYRDRAGGDLGARPAGRARDLPQVEIGPSAMPDTVNLHLFAEMSAEARAALMRRTEADLSAYTEPVMAIIEAVRREGDAALARFA